MRVQRERPRCVRFSGLGAVALTRRLTWQTFVYGPVASSE